MLFAVFADLSRQLTRHERSAVVDALEVCVPGSGCVGPQKGPNDEVYFALDALSEVAANAQAVHYMSKVLQQAGIVTEYALSLQRIAGANAPE
jgi:hypothetical protein